MMRRKYGFIILFCVVLSALYVIPGFAAEWLLGEVYMEDYYQEADMESYSVASASDAAATGSDADYGIMLLSSYETSSFSSLNNPVIIAFLTSSLINPFNLLEHLFTFQRVYAKM